MRVTIKNLFNKLIILYYEFKFAIDFLFFIAKIIILNRVFFRRLFNTLRKLIFII